VNVLRSSRNLALRVTRAAADALGHDLLRQDMNSPLPHRDALGPDLWSRRASLTGLELGEAANLRFLEKELAPYFDELSPPDDPTFPGDFALWNSYYQSVDVEVLYAMIRRLEPKRVLEIGSGSSTLVTASACSRNAAEGHPAEFVAVDPEPRRDLPSVPGLTRVERVKAQDIPLDRYLELESNDVLFVDSSHVVKTGSDVNFLILEVLPRLRPGVVVHFHDIFLPYEYPPAWYERGTYLTEQYLLHAFLIGNRDYRVVFAAHALVRAERERVSALIPSLRARDEHFPAAFWIERQATARS
jgi:predicted O-methyltransferase YrrM